MASDWLPSVLALEVALWWRSAKGSDPDLAAITEPLLIARRVLREQLDVLHRRLLAVVRLPPPHDSTRRLTSGRANLPCDG